MYRIIAFDGGGVRGLIPAMLLEDLVQTIGNENFSDIELLAGTSTGAIIALGIAAGRTPEYLANLYGDRNILDDIFPDCRRVDVPSRRLMAEFREVKFRWRRRQRNRPGLFMTKYPESGRRRVLENALGQDRTVGQLCRHVLISSFQLRPVWKPVAFHNIRGTEFDNTRVVDIAMATSAGPVYFPPFEVENPALGYCVDGGVFANNPSSFALSEAMKLAGPRQEDIRMLSLSTGESADGISVGSVNKIDRDRFGFLQWMYPKARDDSPPTPLLETMFGGATRLAADLCSTLLDECYMRTRIDLPRPISLDAKGELETLRSIAQEYIRGNDWCQIKDWVGTWFRK